MKNKFGSCCGADYAAAEAVETPAMKRSLYENENFEVGTLESGKYYLLNKFTNILEMRDLANYVEALYMAEQFNYALINKTYVMEKIDLAASLNFGDGTLQ